MESPMLGASDVSIQGIGTTGDGGEEVLMRDSWSSGGGWSEEVDQLEFIWESLKGGYGLEDVRDGDAAPLFICISTEYKEDGVRRDLAKQKG